MKRSESKYFNTARRMDDALVSLLSEKDLEFITVKEICDRAGVNRSTFYLHYETIGDLLDECVEAVNERFLAYFNESEHARRFMDELNNAPLEDLVLVKPEYLVPYLAFVRENRGVFAAAIRSPQGMASVGKMEGLYRHIFEPILERFGYPPDERRYAITFYISGIIAVVGAWIEGGFAESDEKMAETIMNCVRPGWRAWGLPSSIIPAIPS